MTDGTEMLFVRLNLLGVVNDGILRDEVGERYWS